MDVVSFDVLGVPTIATGALATLGSGLLVMMASSFCNCFVYCSFCAAVGGTMHPNFYTNFDDVIIALSCIPGQGWDLCSGLERSWGRAGHS